MSLIKKLAGQTAIYGLSSIVGRVLNFLLVPMYTRLFAPAEYGVVTQYYALSGFLLVLLSYRMESAFFRFGTNPNDRENVYSTAIKLIFVTTAVLLGLLVLFVQPLSNFLHQPNHPEYLYMFAGILATDVLCELPFARLRLENRPLRFAGLKIVNISLNIGLNLLFLLLCPYLLKQGHTWVNTIYHQEWGIAYIFLANLIAGLATFLLLLPEWSKTRQPFDWAWTAKFFPYALPLVIVSLAGVVNEMLDRLIMPYLLTGTQEQNDFDLGIYGANYKIAVLLSLFTQAYRYAAEPFFFKHTASNDHDALQLHADTTKWFTIILSGGMLALLLCPELTQLMIDKEYRVGIGVVPILLAANVLLGIYYNFSAWFRLRDKTIIGAWVSVISAVVTIIMLFLLVPKYGYFGAAWATLICYVFLVLATYYTGREHYPAPYAMGRLVGYFALALAMYLLSVTAFGKFQPPALLWAARVFCFAIYVVVVWLVEKRKVEKAQPE